MDDKDRQRRSSHLQRAARGNQGGRGTSHTTKGYTYMTTTLFVSFLKTSVVTYNTQSGGRTICCT